MARLLKMWLYLLGGLAAVAWALLIPGHMRSVDADVITRASKGSRTLEAAGLGYIEVQKPAAAEMFLQAAVAVGDSQTNALRSALLQTNSLALQRLITNAASQRLITNAASQRLITNAASQRPFLSGYLPEIRSEGQSEPILSIILPKARREILHARLEFARNPAARSVLQTRNLTNTSVFPPARSASGAPLDA
ncbi:MAG: hypothetical protein ACO1QB_16190, partial [Verrucomicrobiales bacterium]